MNTTDTKPDGNRWAILNGAPPQACFASWGATEIYPVPGQESVALARNGVFMLKLEDGWHYAHADYSSAYCDETSFGDLPSGACAWLAHQLRNATANLRSAERMLATAKQNATKAQNAYAEGLAAAIAQQKRVKP